MKDARLRILAVDVSDKIFNRSQKLNWTVICAENNRKVNDYPSNTASKCRYGKSGEDIVGKVNIYL